MISEFQYSRILAAALEEAAAAGYDRTSVTAIIARAGVSRKTFYDLYASRDDCFHAVFEDMVVQIGDVVAPLYVEGEGSWPDRVRAALGALLACLESDADVGAFVLQYVVEGTAEQSQARTWLLERLRGAIEDGHEHAKTSIGSESSSLMAEIVVGGALALLHTRMRASSHGLTRLLNPLMSMIVLPYLGPAAASRELRRPAPETVEARRTRSTRGPLDGLHMRVTYRTARVLAAIAEYPGRSNVEVGAEAGIVDAGQTSKLLGRLENLGLIENDGAGQAFGAANAWSLTRRGRDVYRAIRYEIAAGRSAARSR